MQGEDLAGQVVVYLAAGARCLHDASQELFPHRLGGEYDAGDPAVRVLSELFGYLDGQIEVVILFDQSLYLVAVEAHVLSTQADHLLASGEAHQRQSAGDGPAGDDQVAVLRRMGQQSVHEVIDGGTGFYQVVIIQNGDEILWDGLVNLIDYGGDEGIHPFLIELRGMMQGVPALLSEIGEAVGNGGEKVFDENARVAVGGSQGVPAHREIGIVSEVGQQSGFAVAGGR